MHIGKCTKCGAYPAIIHAKGLCENCYQSIKQHEYREALKEKMKKFTKELKKV